MQHTFPPFNVGRPSVRHLSSRSIAALRQAWQWLTLVRADDPVRLVLNRGLAAVITMQSLIGILLAPVLLMTGETVSALVILATIPFEMFIWWLNRRGMMHGALLYMLWCVVGTTLGSPPSSYAGAATPIPLIFVYSIVVATIFIRPRAGLWALILQMAVLGVRLALTDIPQQYILRFLIIGAENLAGITAFLMVGASIFSRALRSSITANTELQRLNAKLEQRVAERTADLQTANHSLLAAKDAAEAANRAKSRFLANMSHELRTPLNAILGYAQILKRRRFEPDAVSGLDIIQSSGEHLLTLINDVLDLAKIEAGKLELAPTKIQLASFLQTIADIIRVRADKKQLSFSYQALTSLPEGVLADATRLRQVLLNLLDNAVKFTDAGQITFRVSVVGSPVFVLSGTPAAQAALATNHRPRSRGMIRFEVEDTGSGIPPKQLDRIFAPFEQGGDLVCRTAGTGLGLAISRQLVQLMSGELCVESEMGRGSRFSFMLMLPITEGAAELDAPSDRVISGYHGPRRTVLVVDDSASNRAVLLHMLRSLGFELAEAADGGQAIALALETRLDLILMDLRLPGIDGLAAAQQLRQLPAMQGIPLIAVSASVANEEQAQSRKMGFDAFLPKPIHWPRLAALLQEQLQIEWVYAEAEDAAVAALEVADPLVPPPLEELARLYELARLGNFYGLRDRAARLETLDPSLIPFARKLRELAQGYHEQAILALLEPFRMRRCGDDN